VSHDQAAELLSMLEHTHGCKVWPAGSMVVTLCPKKSRPSEEVESSICSLKPELLLILEGRLKAAELQERLKQLRSGAND
jgi:hypothetical protein